MEQINLATRRDDDEQSTTSRCCSLRPGRRSRKMDKESRFLSISGRSACSLMRQARQPMQSLPRCSGSDARRPVMSRPGKWNTSLGTREPVIVSLIHESRPRSHRIRRCHGGLPSNIQRCSFDHGRNEQNAFIWVRPYVGADLNALRYAAGKTRYLPKGRSTVLGLARQKDTGNRERENYLRIQGNTLHLHYLRVLWLCLGIGTDCRLSTPR